MMIYTRIPELTGSQSGFGWKGNTAFEQDIPTILSVLIILIPTLEY